MRGMRSSRGSGGAVVQPAPVSRHNKDPREGGRPLRPGEARTRVSSLLAAHQLWLGPHSPSSLVCKMPIITLAWRDRWEDFVSLRAKCSVTEAQILCAAPRKKGPLTA